MSYLFTGHSLSTKRGGIVDIVPQQFEEVNVVYVPKCKENSMQNSMFQKQNIYIYIYTHTHIIIYIHICLAKYIIKSQGYPNKENMYLIGFGFQK